MTYAVPDLLFNSGHLSDALEEIERQLLAEVGQAPEAQLLQVDEDEWVKALAERYAVEAPDLHAEKAWMSRPEEVQVDVSHQSFQRAIIDPSTPTYIAGYRVVAHIPFTGDTSVFSLRPSSFTFNPPRAGVGDDELVDVVDYPHDMPIDIKARVDELVRKVEQYLVSARADIGQHNDGLEGVARSAIQNRRARVQRNYEHLQATGLPMGPPDEDPKTYIADVLVRRPAPVLPMTPTSTPMPLEPVLADQVFEHILGVIRSVGQDMERSPKTYADKGEEDRRHIMLAALNTHYRGQATAEAFNVTGKTDILIRHEGSNLFIAECKFWSGPKGFDETIDQLFGYRAWRDTKLAIVMFVREKDLTSIVDKAREVMAGHPQFVAWKRATTETELRALMSRARRRASAR
jgi:hypothetical protein